MQTFGFWKHFSIHFVASKKLSPTTNTSTSASRIPAFTTPHKQYHQEHGLKMSWDPYVSQLITSGLHHCCIAGHDGHVWGSSPGFKITSKEIARISEAMSDNREARGDLQRKGFTLCGMPYALNRLEDSDDDIRYVVARCKKLGKPARGVVIAKTPKTVIVGIHDPVYSEGQSFGKAKVAISLLADSLFAMSF